MPERPYLASPSATRAILQKYDLRTQKKFGQNFLIDGHIPEKIVAAAALTKEDFVLEIGPGIGTLTQYLAEAAGKVLAIEIDDHLMPVLAETLAGHSHVRILQGDVLQLDLPALLEKEAEGRPIKVVANLPYYITTPILMTMLEAHLPVVSYTLMVQKEVADRMQAGPGSKAYGALSLAVQYFTVPEVVTQVAPSCFLPAPQVGSTVIQLRSKAIAPCHKDLSGDACAADSDVAVLDSRCSSSADDLDAPLTDPYDTERCISNMHLEESLFRVIRAAFQQRRKTLANALRNSSELNYTREEIEAAILACGFRPDVRGEALSLEEFLKLAEVLG